VLYWLSRSRLLFYRQHVLPSLPSFPTRRSSDLPGPVKQADPSPDGRAGHRSGRPRHPRLRPGRAKLGSSTLSGGGTPWKSAGSRSEEHTSELQSRENLVCRLLLEKKKTKSMITN